MADGDKLLRSYATLSSLKSNLPDQPEVEERWVREFNSAVEGIEKALGANLTEFKVPQDELHRSVGTRSSLSDEVTYREGLWCSRSWLMQKIDSILIYFTGLQSDAQRRIGFSK